MQAVFYFDIPKNSKFNKQDNGHRKINSDNERQQCTASYNADGKKKLHDRK